MNQLFTNGLPWIEIGFDNPDNLKFEIRDAYIDKDSGDMSIIIFTDFVLPVEYDNVINASLKEHLKDVSKINIVYQYDINDMSMSREKCIKLLVKRILHSDNSLLAKSVSNSAVKVDGNGVTVLSTGNLMTNELNNGFSKKIREQVYRDLGIRVKVAFKPDDVRMNEVIEDIEEVHRNDIEKARVSMEERKNFHKTSEKVKSNVQGEYRRGKKRKLLVKALTGKKQELSDLKPDSGNVLVSGKIVDIDTKPLKKGRLIVTISITDKKTSTCLKTFIDEKDWTEVSEKIKKGEYIDASGETEWDRYDNCVSVMIKNIAPGREAIREDLSNSGKRVELHAHTKMSALDGFNEPETLVDTAAFWGQPAVAVTDHGVVHAFPDVFNRAEMLKKDKGINIKILYGLEGYLVNDDEDKGEFKKKPSYHIIIIAATQKGIRNIYKLVSLSHLKYFYKKPRIPKSVLSELRDGLILGSACEAGEVYRSIRNGNSLDEIERIAEFYDYLEIQPLVNNRFMVESGIVESNEDLKNLNRQIVELGDRLGKPVVATTDAHYDEPDSAIYRNIVMNHMGFEKAEEGQGLYLRTTDEMLDEFSYLGENMAKKVVIENTNKIADMVDDDIRPVPKEKYPPRIKNAENILEKSCLMKAKEMYGDPLPDEIKDRLNTELKSIIGNGYAVMYVSAQMLVKKSNEDGYLVGSRGSVGSSFAATMAGITEVNPLAPHYICPECKYLEWGDMNKYDCGIDMPKKTCPRCGTLLNRDGFTIPFATFLGFSGDKEPDIDLNFAGEYQSRAHEYVGEIFGEKNVFKAGTVETLKDKLAGAFVREYDEKNDLHINRFETHRLAEGCQGVKQTTGQHPGGMVILPDDHEIFEFCPIQHPANNDKSNIITTHFDYHKIDKNLLKLDILGHKVPSMMKHLKDLTGVDPLNVDLTDRDVLSIFNGIEALNIIDPDYRFTHGSYGIPEFGTAFVRKMLDDIKPERFADLVRISGFSHGTDVWLNNAQNYISTRQATMREVISTRDDIMNYLILKGIKNREAFQIMEDVRKNRPLKEEQLKMMKDHDVPDWYIESCRKIQYMFPRAHAAAYTIMSFRMAWYKVYYPAAFYAAVFTGDSNHFNANVILKGSQACLRQIDDIDRKGDNVTDKDVGEKTILEIAYEMYSRGIEVCEASFELSDPLKFTVHGDKVVLPFVAYNGVGSTAADSIARAYREKTFATVEDMAYRSKVSKTVVEEMRSHGMFEGMPESDQISWL